MFRICMTIMMVLSLGIAQAQSVGINKTGNIPHPSAILDMEADDKGMLVPRMTTSQRSNIRILLPA